MKASPKNQTVKWIPLIGVAASVATALFLIPTWISWPVLSDPDAVFAFNDGNIELAISPTFAYPQILLHAWDNQFFFGNGAGAMLLNMVSLLETLLGPHQFRNWGVPLAACLTGLAAYWCCRRLDRSRPAAFLAALLATLCGWSFTFPTVGLPGRSFTLAWALLSIGMLASARQQRSFLRYAIAGGFLGLGISDTPDVGIFFALTLAVYAVVTHFRDQAARKAPEVGRHAGGLALYVAASALVALQTLLTMYGSNIAGMAESETGPTPQAAYAWATQWSLPPAETWSLIAPDFHGASSRATDSPYWGAMGQTQGWEASRQGSRNFRLAGYALGTTAAVCIALLWLVMLSPRRAEWLDTPSRWQAGLWTGLALMSLMLSWGYHFPLYRLFYALPFMSTIRNPDKWLGPCTLGVVILFALAIDLLLTLGQHRDRRARQPIMTLWLLLVATLVVGAGIGAVYLWATRGLFTDHLSGWGFGVTDKRELDVIFQTAIQANLSAIIIATIVAGAVSAYMFWGRPYPRTATLLLVLCLATTLTVELWRAATPFVIPNHYKHIRASNPMTDFFNAHRSEGRIKLLPPQEPLLNNWRMTYLAAGGYDLFDPVSVRQMPADYGALFEGFGDQIVRLWQLGSVRYFLCPAQLTGQLQQIAPPGTRFIDRVAFGVVGLRGLPIPSSQVPPDQLALRIVEFTGALPPVRLVSRWSTEANTPEGYRAAIKRLAAPAFDLTTEAIVLGTTPPRQEGAAAVPGRVRTLADSPTSLTLEVEAATESLLVRSTKHDPNWRVTLDDQAVELLRVNGLFQGASVPAGRHTVTFAYRPPTTQLEIAVATRLLLVLMLLALWWPRRQPGPASV